MSEPVFCPDIYADGIAKVEKTRGDCVRLWLYVDTTDSEGHPIRIVTAKIVRPAGSLAADVLAMSDALDPAHNIMQ